MVLHQGKTKSVGYKALCDLCLLDSFTFLTSSPMIFLFIHSAPAMSPAKIRYGVASGPLHMLFSLSGLLVSGYLHSSLLYFSEDLLESHLLREATLSIIAIPHHTCLSPFLLYFTSWYSLQCSRLYILSTFCHCLFLY